MKSDVLAPNECITGGGRGLQSIPSHFELKVSVAWFWNYSQPKLDPYDRTKLSDDAPCFFSEAEGTFSEIFTFSGSLMIPLPQAHFLSPWPGSPSNIGRCNFVVFWRTSTIGM